MLCGICGDQTARDKMLAIVFESFSRCQKLRRKSELFLFPTQEEGFEASQMSSPSGCRVSGERVGNCLLQLPGAEECNKQFPQPHHLCKRQCSTNGKCGKVDHWFARTVRCTVRILLPLPKSSDFGRSFFLCCLMALKRLFPSCYNIFRCHKRTIWLQRLNR